MDRIEKLGTLGQALGSWAAVGIAVHHLPFSSAASAFSFFTENLKTIWRAVFFGDEGFDQVALFACRDTMQRFYLEIESFCDVRQGITASSSSFWIP